MPWRQDFAMRIRPDDYRGALRENLKALLKARKLTRETLNAPYLSGPKKGKIVSPRSVGNMMAEDESANGPSLDMVGAVAKKLGLLPWQLLVPGLDPNNPPHLILTDDERKLHREFERLRAQMVENANE